MGITKKPIQIYRYISFHTDISGYRYTEQSFPVQHSLEQDIQGVVFKHF